MAIERFIAEALEVVPPIKVVVHPIEKLVTAGSPAYRLSVHEAVRFVEEKVLPV